MQSFKGYINENLKELIKISVAVDPKNSVKFEALLKKMVFTFWKQWIQAGLQKKMLQNLCSFLDSQS